MNYKFTFEDGSEALAHTGKKGMRWRKGRKSDWEHQDAGYNTQFPKAAAASSNPKKVKTLARAMAKVSKTPKTTNFKRPNIHTKLLGTSGLKKKYAESIKDANASYKAIVERRKRQKLYGEKIT